MKELKILILTQAVWNPRFGAVKVHMDIKDEYERQGHKVDKISLDDLYPKGQNVFSKVFGKLYTEHIFNYLKENANKYDVIDANFSCVVYPKEAFGFKGVVLFRSHGIGPIYQWAEQNIESYKQALAAEYGKIKLKTRLGNLYRSLQKKAGTREFERSVKYADIVHCLNKEEYIYFKKQGVCEQKLLLLPNGIPDSFINRMNEASTLNRGNCLSFIGSWTIRKGIKDLDKIVSYIERQILIEKVVLLGGQTAEHTIKNFFQKNNLSKLSIIPDFEPGELLHLIKDCKVGIFPSFVEGFGLAVVEQLSMGIPVVAYNVPGPSEILDAIDETLLISPGDLVAFSNKVIEILNLNFDDYQALAEKSKIACKKFLLSKITRQFIDKYYECLSNNKEGIA